MSRFLRAGLILVGLLALLTMARPAAAQPYPTYYPRPLVSPYQRPTLSPYLNLLRGGNVAANYYLGVIPDIRQRALNAQYSSALLDLERRTERVEPTTDELLPPLPSTGHPTYFLNYGPYYNLGGPRVSPVPISRPLALSGRR
ncbi:MAG TPA: hypothetical protein VNK04_14090 [Gemmataceae bacterium]|nr:hypothetical protein [Gemmataceae bacterium]